MMDADLRRYKLERLSVAVVDDHEVVLEGLKSFLLKSGVGRVEGFRTAQDFLLSAERSPYDVYLVDVELPDMDISMLIGQLRRLHSEARIIVNTVHEEVWVVRRMRQMGVNGVLYKSGRLDQMLDAVIAVSEGQQFFCRKYRKTEEGLRMQDRTLTRREIDVLKAIAEGLQTKEIAARLFISENTVESHRQNLFSKFGVHNVTGLLMKAIAAGYLNPLR